MFKLIMTLSASAAAVFGASSLAGAAGGGASGQHQSPAVVAVLGPPVSVPPGKFFKAFAYCPKGYLVTGGGAYSGAITEIVSSPIPNLRGWFVDGTNPDPKRTFTHEADAVCMKGSSAVPIGTAAVSGAQVQLAERDFLATHPLPSGG